MRNEIRAAFFAPAISLAVTGAASVANVSHAQQAGSRLDEIVVTARKREESLQDIPISVQAFSAETLERTGALNLYELVQYTPNFIVEQRSTGTDERPVMRGIAVPEVSPTQQTVTFFIDGVSLFGSAANLPLGDVERVEIIRGPQSALFGRATFAGAVNYVLARPTNDFRGQLEGSVGRYDEYRLRANVSGPIVKNTLLFRFGANYSEYGGEHENQFSGEKYGATENRTFSGAVIWAPVENFEATLSAIYSEDRNTPGAYGQFPAGYKSCLTGLNQERQAAGQTGFDTVGWVCGNLDSRDLTIDSPDDQFESGPGYFADTTIVNLALSWDVARVTIDSVTGYNAQDRDRRDNQSRTPNSLFDLFPGGPQARDLSEYRTLFQELRVSSDEEEAVRWLLGGAYRKETVFIDRTQGAQQANFPVEDDIRNSAIFGRAEVDVGDGWTLSAEGRWSRDKVRRDDTIAGVVQTAEETFTTFLPRFIAQFTVSDDLMFYASFARGNRPGATTLTTRTDDRLEEEKNTTYELGAKAAYLDGRVQVGAAVFASRWANIFGRSAFFTDPDDATTLTSIVRNEGDADIFGIELEANAILTERLRGGLSYGYVDAEFKRGYNTIEAINLLGSQAVEFLAGNRPRYVPKHTASANLTWEDQINAAWSWFARGDLSYRSRRFASELNTAYYGDTTLLNVRIGFQTDQLSLEIWGKNLLDDDTILSSGRFVDLNLLTRSTNTVNYIAEGTLPRGPSYGVTARWRF